MANDIDPDFRFFSGMTPAEHEPIDPTTENEDYPEFPIVPDISED